MMLPLLKNALKLCNNIIGLPVDYFYNILNYTRGAILFCPISSRKNVVGNCHFLLTGLMCLFHAIFILETSDNIPTANVPAEFQKIISEKIHGSEEIVESHTKRRVI